MIGKCRCPAGLTDRTPYEELVLDAMLYSARLKENVAYQNSAVIVAMARLIASTFEDGGKLLLCGNGGSAADAQHLATELSIRYRSSVDRPAFPAIALNADTIALTAGANDLGYDAVFTRLAEAYGNEGDVVFGISTSGNSANVIAGLKKAGRLGLRTIALAGGNGGKMKGAAEVSIIVASKDTPRVQESHIMIGHILCGLIEDAVCGK